MVILLDIDGVLVTTPAWRKAEIEADGFLKFNEVASKNLARIINETNATIVLTTTHRITYSLEKWNAILNARGIYPSSISKINDKDSLRTMADRATEIKAWVDELDPSVKYVVIDDDTSINNLPAAIKNRWVLTKSMIGLDDTAAEKALVILLS